MSDLFDDYRRMVPREFDVEREGDKRMALEGQQSEIARTCERPTCTKTGRTYYRYGRSVSTGPWTFNSSSSIQPEQPITLCPEHSLEAFGFALTSLPGDPQEVGNDV